MARILGVIRQSRTDDDTTSLAAQREKIETYAKLHDHEIVAWAVDESTSGYKTGPFERDQLGARLRKPQGWDLLVSAKLDRIGRNVADFAELVKWCNAHGKAIACVSEGFDLSTPVGKMTAQVLMAFAEFEWERIRERRMETVEQLRKSGRWSGGLVPFGYMPEKTPAGYVMVQEPETAGVVRQMIAAYLDGQGYQQIANTLNAQGVPTSTGAEWGSETVRKILTSDNLRGVKVSKGSVIRDDDGEPVTFTSEPILDDPGWEQLQAVLAERSIPRKTPRVNGHLLLRVAYCRTCGAESPLYALKNASRSQGGYYRCRGACGAHVPIRRLEEWVTSTLLADVGDRQLTRRETVRGDDHAKAIAKASGELETLRSIRSVDVSAAVEAAEAEIARLRAMPHEPDRVIRVPVGETVRERWERLDATGRGQFLRDWDVKVWADRDGARLELGWLNPETDTFPLGEKALRRA